MYLDNFQLYKTEYLYFYSVSFLRCFHNPIWKCPIEIVMNSKLTHLSLFTGSGELTWTPCRTGAVLWLYCLHQQHQAGKKSRQLYPVCARSDGFVCFMASLAFVPHLYRTKTMTPWKTCLKPAWRNQLRCWFTPQRPWSCGRQQSLPAACGEAKACSESPFVSAALTEQMRMFGMCW